MNLPGATIAEIRAVHGTDRFYSAMGAGFNPVSAYQWGPRGRLVVTLRGPASQISGIEEQTRQAALIAAREEEREY